MNKNWQNRMFAALLLLNMPLQAITSHDSKEKPYFQHPEKPPIPEKKINLPLKQPFKPLIEEDFSGADLTPYAFPGIVGFRDGKLVGSDHLLNVPNHISIFAEISLPDNQKVPLTTEEIEERVKSIFEKNDIVPHALARPNKPGLPFFHVLVFIFSIPEGYIYNVSGRLFEEVTLPRINLPEGLTMQAITWDREGLRASSKSSFKEEIFESIDETVNSFIERYKFFQTIKKQEN